MNDLALLALLAFHAGPMRLDALAAPPNITLGTYGARAMLEYPDHGPVRSFASVSGVSYARPEVDITLRAGIVLDVGPRWELGWQATDLEAEDSDGGPMNWASLTMTVPMEAL